MVLELLETTYLNIAILDYLLFFSALTLGLLIGKTVNYFYERHIKHRAEASETRLDDIMLQVLGRPVLLLGFVAGAIVGSSFLTSVSPFTDFVSTFTEILLFISVAWIALRVIEAFVDHYVESYTEDSDSKLDDQLLPIVNKMIRLVVFSLTFIVVLDSIGYNVNAIIASLGIGGLALAFAAKATIADMFGGFNILTAKPFHVGDRVDIAGTDGVVDEIGLRYTRLIDLDGRRITVPNSEVASAVVKNISSEPSRRIVMTIGLVYETTPEEMEDAMNTTIETINSVNGILENKTEAKFWEYGDSSMNIRAMYYIDSDNWRETRSTVNKEIQKVYAEKGFDMAFPTREVRLKE